MIFRYFVSDNESKELALRHKYRFIRAKNKRQAIDKIIKLYGYNRVIKDYKAILRRKNNTPYMDISENDLSGKKVTVILDGKTYTATIN